MTAARGGDAAHVKGLYAMRDRVRFVNVTRPARSRHRRDVEVAGDPPNTDAAMILALCHTLLVEKLYNRESSTLHRGLRRDHALSHARRTAAEGRGVGREDHAFRQPHHRTRARDGGHPDDCQIGWSHAAQPSRRAAVLALITCLHLPDRACRRGFGVGYARHLMGRPSEIIPADLPQGKKR